MAEADRPLSPHLQIYRPELTSVLSILHRITGFGLAFGTLFLTWWLLAAAIGAEAYATARWFFASWLGYALLIGLSFSLFYHLFNGIRHLVWDTGMGMDLPSVYRSGWLVVVASVVLTVFAWVIGLTLEFAP